MKKYITPSIEIIMAFMPERSVSNAQKSKAGRLTDPSSRDLCDFAGSVHSDLSGRMEKAGRFEKEQ